MATPSDITVQIEKLEVPNEWPKLKWQILLLLRAHCLEGIAKESQKCLAMRVEAQPQHKKELLAL
jgi:hypothetical protein